MERPELVFVCGCNGAGKSTLTYSTLSRREDYFFIDPDRIAKEKNLTPIEAGREVSAQVKDLIANSHSFVKESTLTSKFDFAVAEKARKAGFKTSLIYVGLQSADLAVLRVQKRFMAGGHSVPESDIRRRYDRSIANLAKAIALFNDVIIYDNSTSSYEEVACFKNGQLTRYSFTPDWFKKIEEELHLSTTCKFPSASLECSMQHDKANADGQSQAQASVGKRMRRRLR